jgi:undecaprenyl-diphosphatase
VVLLGVLGYLAAGVDPLPGEVRVSTWVQSWRSSWLDALMKAISAPGFKPLSFVVVTLTMALLYVKGWRREGVLVALAVLAGTGLNLVIQEWVDRPRPSAELVWVVADLRGHSFPSGHVVQYVLFLGTLGAVLTCGTRPCLTRWIGVALVGLALIGVGISRMYLGTHWPADVLAGDLYGAVVVATVVWLGRRWLDRGRAANARDEAGTMEPDASATPADVS